LGYIHSFPVFDAAKIQKQNLFSAKTQKNDEFWLKMCLFLAKTMENGEFWLINIGVP
jgi:hypothetical protein